MSSSPECILQLKKAGNVALHSGSTSEALQNYSQALELFASNFHLDASEGLQMKKLSLGVAAAAGDSSISAERLCRLESSLYSKRSVVLRKLGQYYFALQDAQAVITISPEWFKGYLRKADIALDCGLYEAALKDYQLALRYLDHRRDEKDEKDEGDEEEEEENFPGSFGTGQLFSFGSIRTANSNSKSANYALFIQQKIGHLLLAMQRERSLDLQLPWLGAALGLVVGMALVTWDYVAHRGRRADCLIGHPMLKLLAIGASAYLFFSLATLQRRLSRQGRLQLLETPYSVQRAKKEE